jgi:hypothetical protein
MAAFDLTPHYKLLDDFEAWRKRVLEREPDPEPAPPTIEDPRQRAEDQGHEERRRKKPAEHYRLCWVPPQENDKTVIPRKARWLLNQFKVDAALKVWTAESPAAANRDSLMNRRSNKPLTRCYETTLPPEAVAWFSANPGLDISLVDDVVHVQVNGQPPPHPEVVVEVAKYYYTMCRTCSALRSLDHHFHWVAPDDCVLGGANCTKCDVLSL